MARLPSVEIQFGFSLPPGAVAQRATDRQARRLVFDYNARAELQDIAGTYESGVATLKAIRAGLYVCLLAETLDRHGKHTARTLSILEVGEIYDALPEKEKSALLEQLQQAMGISEAPKEDRPTMPAPES